MAQFRQPDFSQGDPNTLGGYMAVHDRPAAFEGADGYSYSVEILIDEDPSAGERPWGAYLFFVRWARIGASDAEARAEAGRLPLSETRRVLDELIARSAAGQPRRKWWDAMNADEGEGHHA